MTKTLRFVYANTVKGDGLGSYMIHICARTSFDEDVKKERFPQSFMSDMEESRVVRIEGEGAEADKIEVDTRAYHVKIV